jgi:hypothetical protein
MSTTWTHGLLLRVGLQEVAAVLRAHCDRIPVIVTLY